VLGSAECELKVDRLPSVVTCFHEATGGLELAKQVVRGTTSHGHSTPLVSLESSHWVEKEDDNLLAS
jgi:hypothetical protein